VTTFNISNVLPDCPTCGNVVDTAEHGSLTPEDRSFRFDTDAKIHTKAQPYVLRPCGHEMYGCLLYQDEHTARITEWHQSALAADLSRPR